MRHLPVRDAIATSAVGVAVLLYVLWLAEAALPGMDGARGTGLAVLALGFMASATAVVPSFGQLIHGNKPYLTVTSLLGLVALAAGVTMLWRSSDAALGVLMALLVVLWVVSTTRHVVMTRTESPGRAR